MSSLKGKKTHRSLLKKGFKEERDRKDIFYYYYYNGKRTQIFTKMSHNPGDLSSWHIMKMADQTKLSKNKFTGVADCTVSKEELLNYYLEEKIVY